MKANFKINKKDDCSTNMDCPDLSVHDKQNSDEFEEYMKTLPKGWNLWSTRNSSNKL